MLTNETVAWIAELTGATAEDIAAKIVSEKEEAIAKPLGDMFTDDEIAKRDGLKYNEGKLAGVEMSVKDLKAKYGYEVDGKDITSFMAHHDDVLKTKYSKDSNTRVTELEGDLSNQKTIFEQEINGYKLDIGKLNADITNHSVNNSLLFSSPEKMTMNTQRVISLFKMENPIIEVDGIIGTTGSDGNPVKNPKTGALIPHTETYKQWVVSEGFVQAANGRGGDNEFGDHTGSSANDPVAFQKEWKEKNSDKSTQSVDYQKDYAEWRSKEQAQA